MDGRRWPKAILGVACLLEIVLGLLLAVTHLPLCDEGFYGVPAHELSTTGTLRNPVLESAGVPYLRGIDEHFYWATPLAPIAQAGVFKLLGFGLLRQRLLSVACGLGVVIAWFVAIRKLAGEGVAALTALLLAVDFVFLNLVSRGRADMMSLCVSAIAFAGYLTLRESRLTLAVMTASLGCAVSGLVHPNGGIACLISLLVVILHLDRGRLRWKHAAVAAGCFAALAAAWAIYIAQAPELFVAQFLGNVRGRLGGTMSPAGLIQGEINRYRTAWGLVDIHGIRLVRYLLPIGYLAAVALSAAVRDLRRRTCIFLAVVAAQSLSLIFLEGAKQGWYLVHLIPWFAAVLACSIAWLWERRTPMARLGAAGLGGIALLSVASILITASGRSQQRLFAPAAAYLNEHVRPGELVMARSEFYFFLECRTCLRDDGNLGALSRRSADYIVLEHEYYTHLAEMRRDQPEMYREIERRLQLEYREVFRNSNYLILRRRTVAL